jgi:hypothetical protein
VPDLSVQCCVRIRQAAACAAFLFLLGPAVLLAQGTSIFTLLSTEGRELKIGDEVRGALSASDFVTAGQNYVEAWALEGEPGQEVWIDLVSQDFDSYLYVVGPGLGETLTDDDSGGACHARINLTFLDEGVFRVVASSSSWREAGTYQLRVSEQLPPTADISCGGVDGSSLTALPTDGRELALGQPGWGRLSGLEDTLGENRPVQAWTLEGLVGQSVTVRFESDDFDPYLFAYGPGMGEAMTDDDSGGGLNSELTFQFFETGTYWIGAGALSAGSTGAYTLTVTEPLSMNDLDTEGRVLQIGAPPVGRLSGADPIIDGRPVQAWAFEAEAGHIVTIDMMSDDFDSYLYVVGPGLLDRLEDDDSGEGLNSRLDVTFPNDGTYRVIASSLGGSLGTFTLRVR